MFRLFLIAFFPVIATLLAAPAAVSSQSTPEAIPVDFRACSFRDGKTMADLEQVSATFREYANKNDFHYSAWMLTPQYHSGVDYDVAWLGAWPNGDAFGVSMERWNSGGSSVQQLFDQVVDCSIRHEMAASLPINAPEGTPEDGVLMFYPCSLRDGKTLDEAYRSHLEAGQAMKGLGSLAVSWMFQPVAGAGAIDHDYYHVVGFYRYSDMGATMEMYANRGGRKAQQEILGKVATCDTPTIFDALSVRARDER